MSYSVVRSRTLYGIQAPQVNVEVHLSNGLPSFSIVGLPETAIKESRERVRCAIVNSNYKFPVKRITVNLSPADLPKEGARFDLPIAVAILAASNQFTCDLQMLAKFEFVAELSLDGLLKNVAGILPTAYSTKGENRILAIAQDSLAEASLIRDLDIVSAVTLSQLIEHIYLKKIKKVTQILKISDGDQLPDFSDVKGQHLAKRALEIAASGRHNLLMMGPPGSGKTMLATRLPSIMPVLSETHAVETASIHSISQAGFNISNWRKIPIRAPHHSCSPAALIGGGSKPTPGEVSLAHNGILFLDELLEFDRRALEMLREPLETGSVNVARLNHRLTYLAKFLLIAACNPCQCGYLGSTFGNTCRCSPYMIERYKSKLSGPLFDRFDMHIDLPAVNITDLTQSIKVENSAIIADRVACSQRFQMDRQNKLNSDLSIKELEQHCYNDSRVKAYFSRIAARLNLTARSFYRMLRLARTIADCQQSEGLMRNHIDEAAVYRQSHESK